MKLTIIAVECKHCHRITSIPELITTKNNKLTCPYCNEKGLKQLKRGEE